MASIQDLDARQRMINMMYIIFIAMLALNMSKEVLEAFGNVNESLERNMEQTTERNLALMGGLATKAQEQSEKYQPIYANALQLQEARTDLVDYIESIKSDLLVKVEPEKDGSYDYQKLDSDEPINNLFFANDQLTEKAQGLKDKIGQFRSKAAELAEGNDNLTNAANTKFNVEDVMTKEGRTQDFIKYHYEGFPLIAALTKLTNLQADATQMQSDILSNLVSGQMESDISLENYEGIVIADKTAFFQGENFTGKIVLGRFDRTLKFDKVEVNGREVENVQAGQVNLEFPAGSVGDQDIEGKIYYTEGGEEKFIDFKSSYSVIPKPNTAVISADKMNVVYRGVQNPMTISIPGVPDVSASAPGLSRVGGAKYNMDPTNIQGREVTINVSGSLPDGTRVSNSGTFRIKDIPRPKGTVRSQMQDSGPLRMQKDGLKKSTIGATLPDFDFDLNLAVSGFKILIPGQPIVPVSGNKLDAAAQRAIDGAKRGSSVMIFDIQARIVGNTSYRLPGVDPVMIELTN